MKGNVQCCFQIKSHNSKLKRIEFICERKCERQKKYHFLNGSDDGDVGSLVSDFMIIICCQWYFILIFFFSFPFVLHLLLPHSFYLCSTLLNDLMCVRSSNQYRLLILF